MVINMMRKKPLYTEGIFHIISRSISGYKIFNSDADFERFLYSFLYYNSQEKKVSFSELQRSGSRTRKQIIYNYNDPQKATRRVEIICYCLMPTHIHFILQQLVDGGTSKIISDTLNSYTRYFNIRHKRKGPLWESRFKSVLVETDEQLLHLTRYIHLNPVTARLIKNPQDWEYSSFKEYTRIDSKIQICKFKHLIDRDKKGYYKFCIERINRQRELAKIKKVILENYLG
ncbi:MAG: putative transposase [Candidatus Berkelbacteria bacterium Licking1014_7]|uniref:Putative transposase n=1 Tax=Candidatus Berkelbacteria bacterium Licking1014_7 TaxID=2017147 RepID=A0A554LJF3_9BACT|nr:MAG: putative transposase [Candidatus Berkelbacteria bacterium Licking1014_7]